MAWPPPRASPIRSLDGGHAGVGVGLDADLLAQHAADEPVAVTALQPPHLTVEHRRAGAGPAADGGGVRRGA
ncbi:MAG: hypothetical protein MZW92_60205 [Comamonadaceae bacterium]|nr:hypothetical protein [Comamonadaceae bacterium]